MFIFGIGGLFGRRVGGNAATPDTPQQFGTLQDVSVDFAQKLVQLRGQNKAPDDIAPSDMDFKGKASFATIQIDTYNVLFFADTITTGSKIPIDSEASGAVAANNYSAVNRGANGANFVANLGVKYADGSGTLQETSAGNEATGKYSIGTGNNAGIYKFGGNDAGNNKTFLVSYAYTATTGKTLTVTNHKQGYGPVFEMYLMQNYQDPGNGLHIFAARASKMSAPMKRDNYMISDFEFECFPDSQGRIFEWFQTSA
jgi:hypothetical protein